MFKVQLNIIERVQNLFSDLYMDSKILHKRKSTNCLKMLSWRLLHSKYFITQYYIKENKIGPYKIFCYVM